MIFSFLLQLSTIYTPISFVYRDEKSPKPCLPQVSQNLENHLIANKKVSTAVHSLSFHISNTESYELIDKMKTLKNLEITKLHIF